MTVDTSDSRHDNEQNSSVESISRAKPFPGVLQALILLFFSAIVLIVIAVLAFVILFLVFGIDIEFADMDDTSLVWMSILILFCNLFFIFVGWHYTRRSFSIVFPIKPVASIIFPPLILLTIGDNILGSELANYLESVYPMSGEMKKFFNILMARESWLSAIFLISVVAPVTEEAFCRGLLLYGFSRWYSRWKAIIAQAVFFAAIHMNLHQVTTSLVFGILMGWLFLRTGSLLPCIVAHSVNNSLVHFVSFVLNINIKGYNYVPGAEGAIFQPLWFNLLGVVLTITGLYWLLKVLPRGGYSTD